MRVDKYAETITQKVADYLGNIVTLIVNATVDLPCLISLQCDLGRMPNIEPFRSNVMTTVAPILKNARNDLPPEAIARPNPSSVGQEFMPQTGVAFLRRVLRKVLTSV
jgi:hypothetical protein